MLKIDIAHKIKSSNGMQVLSVKADVRTPRVTGIYGNSGEGKSTLFNIIAGFLKPDQGTVSYNGIAWYDALNEINLLTKDRKIAYIFQENNLFPHFTIKENINFAIPKNESANFNVDELLDEVGLLQLKNRYPHQLSGGQAQRVAIVRALVQDAQVILMDEPFTALDLEIKWRLYKVILAFQEKYRLNVLLISHDLDDLYKLCDEVLWIQKHSSKELLSLAHFKDQIQHKLSKL
jgi:molybdate transport system ATP-binding protein